MTQTLKGVRILDLAGGVAGGYCSKLLADLGADVILIEPPEGDVSRRLGPFPGDETDAERSGLFLYLHVGKRSVVADLSCPDGVSLVQGLVGDADVLLTSDQREELAAKGLDVETLRERHPALVHVSLTHFGVTGPYRDWAGDEITD